MKNLDIIYQEYGNKSKDLEESDIDSESEKYKYKIECSECGYTFYRKRLTSNFLRKYRCGKCLGKFTVKEGIFYSDKNVEV